MMFTMLQGVFIVLVTSLTSVSMTMSQPSQSYASYFPYFPGNAFHPGSLLLLPAETGRTSSKGDDIGQSRGLGFIDRILLKQLLSKFGQLEETINTLNANSQATKVELATLKSDLVTFKGTIKGDLDSVKLDLTTFKRTVKDDLDSVKLDLTTFKETIENDLDSVKLDLATFKGTVKDDLDSVQLDLTTFKETIEDDLNSVKLDLTTFKGTVKDDLDSVKLDLTTFKETIENDLDSVKLDLATFKETIEDDLDSVKLDLTTFKGTVKDDLDSVKLDLTTFKGTIKDDLDSVKLDLTTFKGTIKDDLDSVKLDLATFKGTVKDDLDNVKLDLTTFKETVEDGLNTVTSDLLIVKGIVEGLTKPTSIGGMPTSCGDLKNLGNTKSGLFNIKSDTKVATVYCDFTATLDAAGFQQWIGYADVKSVPVYFYVQKTTTVSSVPKITFITEKLNEGNAMDISTGVFTAPVDGTYFFSFTATVDLGTGYFFGTRLCVVQLTLNDVIVGNAEINGFPYIDNQLDSLHLEATLNLKKGDQVWLKSNIATGAALLGGDLTVFTGMLLAEINFPSA